MNESQLILADFLPKKTQPVQTIGLQDIDLGKLFTDSQEKNNKGITYLYIHPEVEKVLNSILQNSNIIKAAGGIVKNGEGDYLFIHRLGKWDLPKGKVENGEKMRQAAVREVEEECGLKIDYLGPKASTTYHTYQMNGKVVLKQTNWYEMGVNEVPKLIPQLEEDITKAKWVSKSDFQKITNNTYPLIADIVKEI